MTMIFKYIITDLGAVLFNEVNVHSVVAEGFKPIYAAGFCSIDEGVIKCWGKSESLKVESKPPIDKIIITDLFNPVPVMKYFGGLFNGKKIKEMYK